MPSALLRPCPEPGCPELVESGRCAKHQTHINRRRGSAHSRGYTRQWEKFKAWFIARLIALGIAPVCGARMPDAPKTGDSQCQAAGRLNDRCLHLDHTPPLSDAERQNPAIVCDPQRVQLLCEACHNAKSAREQA